DLLEAQTTAERRGAWADVGDHHWGVRVGMDAGERVGIGRDAEHLLLGDAALGPLNVEQFVAIVLTPVDLLENERVGGLHREAFAAVKPADGAVADAETR